MNILDKQWLSKVKILYVEDELEVQQTTVDSLSSFFDVIVAASDGQEALEIFKEQNDFDIVVTDINMPKINGIELAKHIRKLDSTFPIIIITAHTEREFLEESINININGYTLKPVNLKNLITSIMQAAEGRMLRKELERLNNELIIQLKETTSELDSILNAQETMVIVVQENYIHTANKQFLKFVGHDNLQSFNMEYQQVKTSLSKTEGYYLLDHYTQFASLTNLNDKTQDVIVKLNDNIFKLNITSYNTNGFHYVLTFTDITDLHKQADILKYQAYHDSLTKLYNRQKFNEILTFELNRSIRYGHSFTLAMFDIDFFKNINDTYGHDIGDEVLINLSNTVKHMLRETDVIARWGGEEFMILFPETLLEDGKRIIEKVRETVAQQQLSSSISDKITCSFGVTQYKEKDTFNTLLKRVDIALYQAKNDGRNKVVVY